MIGSWGAVSARASLPGRSLLLLCWQIQRWNCAILNGTPLIANNDWQDNPAQAAELTAAGRAPAKNLESAIAATLPPGLCTALLAGRNNGTASAWLKFTTAGRCPSESLYAICELLDQNLP
jgi:hypothetical protein